jgi:predicted permease
VPGAQLEDAGISTGLYVHYADRATSFESIATYGSRVDRFLAPDGTMERVAISMTSAAVFRTLQVRPLVGRLFTHEDAAPGFMNMKWTIPVLLAHDFWRDRFGGDPGVVGRVITLGDNPRVVIGVMPDGFVFPDAHTQIWMLFEPSTRAPLIAGSFTFDAIARLRPNVSAAAAQAELAAILPSASGRYPDATPERLAQLQIAPHVIPLKAAVIGHVSRTIWTLFAAVSCLLLIAAANVAGLFAVRADARRGEIALRQALGAGRGRLIRLLFLDALLLTGTAAAVGLVLARALLGGIVAWSPVELPRASEVAIGPTAAAFAFGVALVLAIVFGTLGLGASGRSARTNLRGATGSRLRRGVEPFIVVQVALTLMLMVGSALMVRTYQNLSHRALGFSSSNLVTALIGLPYREATQHARIYRALVDRIAAMPHVTRATAASFAPLTPSGLDSPIEAGTAPIPFKFFVPGYFQTMGIRIIEGDSFEHHPPAEVPYPVLVSRTLAKRMSPGGAVIGRQIRRLNDDGTPMTRWAEPVEPFTIAGVVDDVRETSLRDEPPAIVYVPIANPPVEQVEIPTDMHLMVRLDTASPSIAPLLRQTIADVDPGVSVGAIETMDAIVERSRGKETFVAALLLGSALTSLILGVIGIYGSVAQVIRLRTREIGIRVALGARPTELVRMVTSASLASVLLGGAIGVTASIMSGGALASLLFGVAPRDPIAFAGALSALVVAAVAAAGVASVRAIRLSPVVALRIE